MSNSLSSTLLSSLIYIAAFAIRRRDDRGENSTQAAATTTTITKSCERETNRRSVNLFRVRLSMSISHVFTFLSPRIRNPLRPIISPFIFLALSPTLRLELAVLCHRKDIFQLLLSALLFFLPLLLCCTHFSFISPSRHEYVKSHIHNNRSEWAQQIHL